VNLSERISIVGQVLDLSTENQMIANARVAVVSEGSQRHGAYANEFGEFSAGVRAASADVLGGSNR
jgi:hypothetical protein